VDKPDSFEGVLAQHRASCPECRAGGSWADCPEGNPWVRAEIQRLADESRARIGPFRYWLGRIREVFFAWADEPDMPLGYGSFYAPPTTLWGRLRDFITGFVIPVTTSFVLVGVTGFILARIVTALYVGFRVFLRVLFRP